MAGKMKKSEASTSRSGGGETVVVDCGRRKSSCGYCKSAGRTSISHGLWAHSITVDHYQDLLDQGWRRSGCFLYKPEMERTCCPSYTIRLKASDFVPSKDQLRVQKRMLRFLDGSLDFRESMEDAAQPKILQEKFGCASLHVSSSGTKESLFGKHDNAEDFVMKHIADQIDHAVHSCTENGKLPNDIELPKASVKKVNQVKKKLLVEGAGDLLYSCSISFQIAAAIRRSQSANSNPNERAEDDYQSPKIIAGDLGAYLHSSAEAIGLAFRACNGHLNFYAASSQASTREGTRKMTSFEKSSSGCKRKGCCLSKSSEKLPGKRRKLEIVLKKSSFDPEEFALYRRYQMKVHNDAPDRVSESSYKRFLVDTPLVYVPPTNVGRVPPCGFGSFHQQYLVDGKLIAVGVIDILPKCLSSKYLFWDPDFAFLSLGKYSALQEIGWVKENQLHCPSLQYYYLGYYIHSCRKMRYKAAYCPSELLCPLRYLWVPFDSAKPFLDREPYVILSDLAHLQNGDSLPHVAAEDVLKLQKDNNIDDDRNDVSSDDDDEMVDAGFESSDDESDPENGSWASGETENGDVGEILIGLKGSRWRYKDLQRAFGHGERLESQLLKYKKVVGDELSKRIVYSLG